MKFKAPLWIAGAAVVAVIAGGGYYWSGHKTGAAVDFATLATPIGITLQPLGPGQGFGIETHAQFGAIPPFKVAYADARGMTLYTYAKDVEAGKSSCTADCAKAWPPAAAAADAKPVGDWTVIAREDGSKQWAYKGQPLYTYAQDKDPGSVGGNSPYVVIKRGAPGAAKGDALAADWHAAIYDPSMGAVIPHGLSMHDVADANGEALIDVRGMTLYAFAGDVKNDKPVCAANTACPNPWTPLAAPQLADTAGDFTFIVRDDGIKQWAYKGAPLYTYEGDLAPGYANGIGVDSRWKVALVSRYFMPSQANLQLTPGRGKVWSTATGSTLYRRDAVGYQTGGGHSFRHGVVERPAVGHEIGTTGCDAECQKTWHPFKAAADAQSSGYWDVVTRDDGSKQWAYKGFALYTYDGDKKAGDMTGNDIYDIALSDDPNKRNDIGTPQAGAAALYWLISEP